MIGAEISFKDGNKILLGALGKNATTLNLAWKVKSIRYEKTEMELDETSRRI